MAEWSKALVSGTSRNRRGFEPHFRQTFFVWPLSVVKKLQFFLIFHSSSVVTNENHVKQPKRTLLGEARSTTLLYVLYYKRHILKKGKGE